MKNSILDGAANSAPIQSQDHCPSGKTRGPEKSTSKLEQVTISNTDRKPSTKGPQFQHDIGGK